MSQIGAATVSAVRRTRRRCAKKTLFKDAAPSRNDNSTSPRLDSFFLPICKCENDQELDGKKPSSQGRAKAKAPCRPTTAGAFNDQTKSARSPKKLPAQSEAKKKAACAPSKRQGRISTDEHWKSSPTKGQEATGQREQSDKKSTTKWKSDCATTGLTIERVKVERAIWTKGNEAGCQLVLESERQVEDQHPDDDDDDLLAKENAVATSWTLAEKVTTKKVYKCKSASGKIVSSENKITAYFPVRKSYRKTESQIKEERLIELKSMILSSKEDSLEVREIKGKGRGVIAKRKFEKGEFIVEYRGELISRGEALRREEVYNQDCSIGCYMYYFTFQNKQYCIDATDESEYKARLINHSAKEPNCVAKVIEVNSLPCIAMFSSRIVRKGEELLYNYGDTRRSIIQTFPWLVNS